MVYRPPESEPQRPHDLDESPQYPKMESGKEYDWMRETESIISEARRTDAAADWLHTSSPLRDRDSGRRDTETGPWIAPERDATHLKPINLAPLKGVLESDPLRSKILRVLIEDGGWVTTADLLRVARQVRSIMGAVTIGTILSGLNDLVSARLVLSRSSLGSGIDWAEWRINPDWLKPTRRLLQMLTRARLRETHRPPE